VDADSTQTAREAIRQRRRDRLMGGTSEALDPIQPFFVGRARSVTHTRLER
jgi:hypothetical protein